MDYINLQGQSTVQQPIDKKKQAKAAFIISIIGLIAAFIPFVNFLNIPAQITAFILGIIGLKSSKKGLAIAGIVISVIVFLLTLLILGAYAIAMFGSIVEQAREKAGQ